MTVVYHELLPESYLLILAPGSPGGPEEALANSLDCAQHSGKAAVWVDCSLLNGLSDEDAQLLWALHQQLQAHHSELVLVHVPDHLKGDLFDRAKGAAPRIVSTLLDAAQHPQHTFMPPMAA